MTYNLRYLSAFNGFIPRATGEVIAYIRKPEMFPLNRYVKYIPTKAVVGLYAMLGRDQPIRVVSDGQFTFADGADRPRGLFQQVPYLWQQFQCTRRSYDWELGYLAIEHTTGWEPKLVHAAMAVSVALTNRTNRIIKLIENSTNWGTHANTATALNGGAGTWQDASDDPTSPKFQAIYKSLAAAFRQINLDTNGVVKWGDLRLVISPGLAITMSQAPEIINYVRETPQALEIVEKGLDPQFNQWGMPRRYRGLEIVVEDSVIQTANVNETAQSASTAGVHPSEGSSTRAYIKQDTSAVLLTRQGAIDGEYGAPSFETLQMYYHGELLEVLAWDDPKNKRVDGAVEENIAEVLATNVSGFLIQGTM